MRVREKSYGTAIGCQGLDQAVANLGTVIQAAQAVGLDSTNLDYAAAANFYGQQTTWYTQDWFDGSATCTNQINTATTLAQNLSKDITAAGGVAPTNLPATPPPPPGGPLGSLFPSIPDWVLPVGAGIVGLGLVAYLFGPLIRRLSKPKAAVI